MCLIHSKCAWQNSWKCIPHYLPCCADKPLDPWFLYSNSGLTHWSWVTHICVSELTIIGSDNGLSPERGQAIIWTNAGILLFRALGINFSEILSKIHIFSVKKMLVKISSGKWRPLCLGLNMLINTTQYWIQFNVANREYWSNYRSNNRHFKFWKNWQCLTRPHWTYNIWSS